MRTYVNIVMLSAFLSAGCGPTASRANRAPEIRADIKDVYRLTVLIRDHLRSTNEHNINVDELMQHNAFKMINGNFEKIEMDLRADRIAVLYKFSNARNSGMIELTEEERELVKRTKVIERQPRGQYDGEIQLDYGERFYNVRKIVIGKMAIH